MAEDKKGQSKPLSLDFLKAGTAKASARAERGELDSDEQKRCKKIADEVNAQLPRPFWNLMKKCDGEFNFEWCQPLRVPDIKPLMVVLWGDSQCDCIEGDDTEIVSVVVCNPYSNLVMSHFTINRIVVVQADGSAVPLLPDGTPSIQLVPLGPYCFDDIQPCTCVWRQFVLRLRGAPGGAYRILLQGVCFEACFHELQEECFTFNVCRD